MHFKNIIAVVSTEGGVGKSTIALNLALALQKEGIKVGLLDSDIYGLSQAHLLRLDQSALSKDGTNFKPIEAYGLPIISMAYILSQPKRLMALEGASAESILEQLFFETHWPKLDCLIIDFPSGMGDVQLSMIKKIPVTYTIMVTLPRKKVILEAKKAVMMFRKINIPVRGIIENMATYFYSPYQYPRDPRDERLASPYIAPLLGQLIVDSKMCESSQTGVPWMKSEKYQEHSNTAEFYKIARKISDHLQQNAPSS